MTDEKIDYIETDSAGLDQLIKNGVVLDGKLIALSGKFIDTEIPEEEYYKRMKKHFEDLSKLSIENNITIMIDHEKS